MRSVAHSGGGSLDTCQTFLASKDCRIEHPDDCVAHAMLC